MRRTPHSGVSSISGCNLAHHRLCCSCNIPVCSHCLDPRVNVSLEVGRTSAEEKGRTCYLPYTYVVNSTVITCSRFEFNVMNPVLQLSQPLFDRQLHSDYTAVVSFEASAAFLLQPLLCFLNPPQSLPCPPSCRPWFCMVRTMHWCGPTHVWGYAHAITHTQSHARTHARTYTCAPARRRPGTDSVGQAARARRRQPGQP